MNTFVQAAALTISVKAEMTDAIVSTKVILSNPVAQLETSCLYFSTILTVNGHSIKAINPDFVKVGELATSLA
jgi:hypothetical protein